jgi:threonylcarbamoyladenosine tRNA methylthiotransferase MtaB
MEEVKHNKTAVVHVLGCKVNQAEAAAMARLLGLQGYAVEPDASNPDLIVVNTCCVTSRAEGKSRRLVHRLAEEHPRARLIVTGCLAEVYPESISGLSEDQQVLGASQKDRFAELISEATPGLAGVELPGESSSCSFGDLAAAGHQGRARAYLKVQDGCSQGCAYCIVPRARGASRSLHRERAIEYAQDMEASGFAEIVLTGIHLGTYGSDLEPRLLLEDLLERLLDACPTVRFRLSSVEPQEITLRLIELVGRHPRVCRHFHIPMQSGHDGILARMGRPYDATFIVELVERIFQTSPEACVGMDIMVGFPGEDDRAFEQTRSLIEQLEPAYLHVFPFSPRPGTPAASFRPHVPREEAQARVEGLRALSAALRKSFYERFIGKVLVAVPEKSGASPDGVITARTDNYIPVKVVVERERQSEKQFRVRIEKIVRNEVWGKA